MGTAVELSRQGEVLTRAEQKVDNINENLNTAEHHISTIKSWWGGFTNKFKKQPAPRQPPNNNTSTSENTQEASVSQSAVINKVNNVPVSQPQASSSSTGQMHQYDLYENQIDSNLDQMSAGLGRLKNLGMGLNTELNTQDKQLERLNKKMARVDARTENVNSVLRGLNK